MGGGAPHRLIMEHREQGQLVGQIGQVARLLRDGVGRAGLVVGQDGVHADEGGNYEARDLCKSREDELQLGRLRAKELKELGELGA